MICVKFFHSILNVLAFKSLQNLPDLFARFIDSADVGEDDIGHVGKDVPVLQLNAVHKAALDRLVLLSFIRILLLLRTKLIHLTLFSFARWHL